MPAPTIGHIAESVLYTTDLTAAVAFYLDVVGLKLLAGDPERFQCLQAGDHQVLLLFKQGATLGPTAVPGGIIPPHDGTGPHHLGFAIAAADYDPWLAWLRARSVTIESETRWPRGGRSLYFRDPDGHLIELITPGIWPNY